MTPAHVVLEVAVLRKGCIAVHTGKGTLSRVGEHVPLEVALVNECSRTQVALEGTLSRVSANVQFHVCPFPGHIAAPPARMQSAMHNRV